MDWLEATYHIESTAADIEARAESLAIEQSIEMPPLAVRQSEILESVLAQVVDIQPQEKGFFRVVVRMAIETTALEPAGLLNVLFGNSSLHDDVELVDMHLPQSLLEAFSGPKFGIDGLRGLTHTFDRPLTCTALKPQGSSAEYLADLAYTFALGGVDIIKDDHGITNQSFAPFARRVPAIQKAVERANLETGGHSVYAPMLVGSPKKLAENLKVAREEGIKAVLVAPMLIGVPVFYELVQDLGMAVLGHPAFSGGRVAPPLLLGKLFRLFGADATIFTNYGGRFAYSTQTCMDLAEAARAPWGHLLPTMPTPAGGMTLERVDELIDFYGDEVMLLISGDLLVAEDISARTRAFVSKVAASVGHRRR